MIEIKCFCGHTLEEHAPEPLTWCYLECFFEHPTSINWQHLFVLDNLSYIERLYEEKQNIYYK